MGSLGRRALLTSSEPTVLITGGAGFIGSHLSAYAFAQGARVVVLDDLSSPPGPGIVSGAELPGIEFMHGDVRDAELVDRLVEACDVVVHLAAVVGVRRVLEDPLRCIEVNDKGSTSVLYAAARHGRPVLYGSSSEVYGGGGPAPFREDGPLLIGPPGVARWVYASGKLHGEMLGFSLARAKGLPFMAVRMFNIAGVGQSAEQGMVLPSFVRWALAGEPLCVFSPGTQRRSFMYVGDAVRIIWQLLGLIGPEPRVLNVGNPRPTAIVALAGRVKALSGSASPVTVVDPATVLPAGFGEILDRVPDCERLHDLVGEVCHTPLDTIIAEVVGALRP